MGLFEVNGIWMYAIEKTVFHSIWIGLLILALLRLALTYIPGRLSGLRYNISVSALLLLFISCIAAFLLLYEPISPMQDAPTYYGAFPRVNIGETALDTSLLFTLFGYIYFAGALFMLLRSVMSVAYIRKLQSSGAPLGPEWQARFMQICKSLEIKRSVEFLESVRVKGPLLLAYMKPVIIIPAGMITLLPVSQIETILMHELYHLKRRDFLVNIMQLFVEGVLFYHPVVWIISGFIRSEREHCCDDMVLRETDNPVNYARALIHIAEQQQFTRLAPGAVGSRKDQFYSRIKRILNYNTMKTNMRDKILSLSLLAGSIILLLTISGFSAGPSFFRIDKMHGENMYEPADPIEIVVQDTIRKDSKHAELEELEEPDWEEIEAAHLEALEEIEEIDWEEMKVEIEAAHLEALEEIEEIDWEEVREEMRQSFSEMKLDMEEMKREIETSMNEIDWDEIREDIKEDMENVRLSIDSIKIELDL
ncbi:MAG: hypothetical protein DRJ13_05980 [Bacteroidetes bacterium]|nr:MAG: hypothetical protein DRJ13_05980 [Bacteroidota bacterium]